MSGREGSPTRIAGAVRLDAVMVEVRMSRAVLHSRADLLHAFAWAVRRLDAGVAVRLETRQADGDPLDLLCAGPHGRTAIEFTYCTAGWEGRDPGTGEEVRLPGTLADRARLDFTADVARLERLCHRAPEPTTGIALVLTNDPSLWSATVDVPDPGRAARGIHEGRRLTGAVHPAAPDRGASLGHPYAWREFAHLDGRYGEFRWLAAPVDAGRAVANERAG